jgi:hypothetical protein
VKTSNPATNNVDGRRKHPTSNPDYYQQQQQQQQQKIASCTKAKINPLI